MPKFVGFVLCMLLVVSFAYAKEAPVNPTSDVTPIIGPVSPASPGDVQWDVLLDVDAEALVVDNQLLGCEFANGNWYITGGGNAVDPNKLYKTNAACTQLLATVNQPAAATGWGVRDLAFDGTYLYGGCEATVVYAFDPVTLAEVPAMNIPRPAGVSVVRALAYDPATDHFWTGNFSSNLVEFTRTGSIVWQGPPPTGWSGVYGMAWDAAPGHSPILWIFDQTGTPLTQIKGFNPVTHAATGVVHQVAMLSGLTDQIAGGLCFTNQWNPQFWTFGGIVQGTAHDKLFALEMYISADLSAPGAPTNFAVANTGATLQAHLSWTNPTLNVGGTALTQLTSMKVVRNGDVVATLTPVTPGQAMTYNDPVPSVGNYDYQVYGVNSFGNGIPVSGSAWIGLDVPGAVTNLTGAGVGTTLVANLSWTNPTAGQHGGYWPAGSITGYNITRAGQAPGTFTVTGLATSFTDNSITQQGWYTYTVQPYNASGNGASATTASFYVGPPEFGVQPYEWVEIANVGTNTLLGSDDQTLGPFDIGFAFPFYGQNYSQFKVCSNGWMTFDITTTATSYTNGPLPVATTLPNLALYPLWDDLNCGFATSGDVWYQYQAANGRFILEWDNVASYTTPNGLQKFEIILYPSGQIDFMYHTIAAPTIGSFTVGRENAGGTVGTQVCYNGVGPIVPTSSTGIRFYAGPPPVNPNVTIDLAPVGAPIVVPAAGGTFSFNATIQNHETTPQNVGIWILMQLPSGSWYGPVLGPLTLTNLPGGATITRLRNQTIPATAPAGAYWYQGRVGVYSTTIWDSSGFAFTKSATDNGGAPVVGWENYGESFDFLSVAAPVSYAMINAYPNPFNPTTTLSYTLPEASRVTLKVYDLSGRTVATLVDGMVDAGQHQATFDGTGLASGVYLYTLNANGQMLSGKMALVK